MANRLARPALLGAGLWAGLVTGAEGVRPDEARLENPRLGEAEAVSEGRRLYRTRCVICHGREGGRGPNLFATQLDDEAFLTTVIQGRGTMPSLGLRMSPDEVWAVHAYVRSTDHYE